VACPCRCCGESGRRLLTEPACGPGRRSQGPGCSAGRPVAGFRALRGGRELAGRFRNEPGSPRRPGGRRAASATNPAVRGGREVAGPLPATEPGSPRRPGGRRAASRNGTRQSQHPRRPRARRAASATDPAVLPSAPAGVRTQPRAPSHRHHPAFTAMASRAGGLASQGPAAHQTNGREDDRQRPACARALGSLRHRGGGGAPANTPGAPYLQPVAPAAAARAGRAPGRCRQARPGGFRVRPGGPPMGA
jgi:hypothetical protein